MLDWPVADNYPLTNHLGTNGQHTFFCYRNRRPVHTVINVKHSLRSSVLLYFLDKS